MPICLVIMGSKNNVSEVFVTPMVVIISYLWKAQLSSSVQGASRLGRDRTFHHIPDVR